MHLIPNSSEYDMLLLFKRGIKNKIQKRVEHLPDNYISTNYIGYTVFTDKQKLKLNINRAEADRRKEKKTNPNRNYIPSGLSLVETTKNIDGDIEI